MSTWNSLFVLCGWFGVQKRARGKSDNDVDSRKRAEADARAKAASDDSGSDSGSSSDSDGGEAGAGRAGDAVTRYVTRGWWHGVRVQTGAVCVQWLRPPVLLVHGDS